MRYWFIIFCSATIFGQQYKNVDFKSAVGKITVDPIKNKVSGKVLYDFDVLKLVDTIYIDAQNMTFDNVCINNKKVDYKNSGKKIALFQNYKLGKNTLSFDYVAQPKQAIYFNKFNNNWQIWTQGQGKYTSNWFPSFDDVNEKLIFSLSISFDKNYEVVSNGMLVSKSQIAENNSWEYKMKQPMSSYLLMMAIGKYQKSAIKSESGIPIELYIEPEDSLNFEPTYRYSKQIFDFLEKKIGVKYPWQIYKQIPFRDFLYAGMENTTSTVFSREFVVDSIAFNEKNYVEVNAHELAHHWFGNLITATEGKHHWLQEGFATYYALLAQKKIFGDDFFYNELYNYYNLLKLNQETDKSIILSDKASSLIFYQKGAWALHIINEKIGTKKFDKIIKRYLKKHQFKTVYTNDFLNEIARYSKFDIQDFENKWLKSGILQESEILAILNKNNAIKTLLKIKSLEKKPFEQKKNYFLEVMKSDIYYPAKSEILIQINDIPFQEKIDFINFIMQSKDLAVRNELINTLNDFPETNKNQYESFLFDANYDTKLKALTVLTKKFPADKKRYFEIAKNWQGENDKRLRIHFLALNIFSESNNIDSESIISYKKEIVDYSSSNYEFSVRQNAIIYLKQLQMLDKFVLENLLECCLYKNWRYAKWGKDFLKEILSDEKIKQKYLELLPSLNTEKHTMFNRFLK